MTAQMREDLGPLQDSMRGERVWIVGSGPSLDDVDLMRIRGEYIFALNAAYTLFRDARTYGRAWWLWWDMRVYREVFPRMIGEDKRQWPVLRAILHKNGMENMRSYRGQSRTIVYPREERFRPKRTVAETALLIADFLGFNDAYLVGIDGLVARGDQPYAKLLSWKRCHFMNTERRGSWQKSHAAFRPAIAAAMERIERMRIWQTSSLYRGPEFKRRGAEKRHAAS